MSIGLKADPSGNSGAIQIAGVDKVVVTNAGDVAATTFTGNLIGNADTATKFAATTGTAPVFGVRAWVNFDGTKDTTGAVSTANTNRLIRASGNVTNVLRTSTGNYSITLTTPMINASFSVVGTAQHASGLTVSTHVDAYPVTASTVSVWTAYTANSTFATTNYDPTFVDIWIIG